jgi:hypothetical protein
MNKLIITLILVATCNTAMSDPGSSGVRASGADQAIEKFKHVCVEGPAAISAPGTAIGSTIVCYRLPIIDAAIERGRFIRKHIRNPKEGKK